MTNHEINSGLVEFIKKDIPKCGMQTFCQSHRDTIERLVQIVNTRGAKRCLFPV